MSSFIAMTEQNDDIPEGYLLANDPVLQYLSENKDGSTEDLIVARPTEALRAIYATINGIRQEECLIDNGSMMVSISREVATQLGLTWDPSLTINMESASGHVERTLGIAKNVCFKVGGLKIYLQVHILENPPYRVLLGRPFDTFTKSTVKNSTDGSSELVLTDPNTKTVAIVPTYARGVGPEELHKIQYQAF
jgi:hypothetical protein